MLNKNLLDLNNTGWLTLSFDHMKEDYLDLDTVSSLLNCPLKVTEPCFIKAFFATPFAPDAEQYVYLRFISKATDKTIGMVLGRRFLTNISWIKVDQDESINLNRCTFPDFLFNNKQHNFDIDTSFTTKYNLLFVNCYLQNKQNNQIEGHIFNVVNEKNTDTQTSLLSPDRYVASNALTFRKLEDFYNINGSFLDLVSANVSGLSGNYSLVLEIATENEFKQFKYDFKIYNRLNAKIFFKDIEDPIDATISRVDITSKGIKFSVSSEAAPAIIDESVVAIEVDNAIQYLEANASDFYANVIPPLDEFSAENKTKYTEWYASSSVYSQIFTTKNYVHVPDHLGLIFNIDIIKNMEPN